MENVIWFTSGLFVGLVADFFLVLFMTRNFKKKLEYLDKSNKSLKETTAWLERQMYRLENKS